jgi:acylpyruvate hydrolase
LQFISYLAKGQVRSARLVGKLGIDLNSSTDLYVKQHSNSKFPLDKIPTSLTGLFSLGSEGMALVANATNWILGALPESDLQIMENGIVFDIDEVTLLAPIPCPGKVLCIAGNFPAPNKMERPDFPTVFLKPSGGITGSKQPIAIPKLAQSVAYEVELAVVIGKSAKNISSNEAVSFIAGYTLANDLGDRLLEKRTSQWTSGKMFDTFTPMGPILITPDEMGETSDLAMLTRVNGQVVQKGNTSQMFFDIPHLISYLSSLTTLEAGDVVLTGSPKLMDGEPNPIYALKSGDVVEIEIERLTSLSNPVISAKETV